MTDSVFTWGTVTTVSPLRVRLDGDAVALPLAPNSLIDPNLLAVGDRVRCEIANRRLVIHGRRDGDQRRGTTAQRDAIYGIPATDPARVALANRRITWFNTDKGWTETYYAVAGTAGLSVPGLVAGTAPGWYPVGGTLMVATRLQVNGFQLLAAGVVTATNLSSAASVNIGGFTFSANNAIIPPMAGRYDISASVYFSGGGPLAYNACIVRLVGGGDLLSSRVPSGNADAQTGVSAPGVALAAGQGLELMAQAAAAQNVYGDGVTRRTFLALEYAGPALAS